MVASIFGLEEVVDDKSVNDHCIVTHIHSLIFGNNHTLAPQSPPLYLGQVTFQTLVLES